MNSDKITGQTGFEFSFDSAECSSCRGRCCRGYSGFVRVDTEEIERMARAKKLDVAVFSNQFVRHIESGLSLKERVVNGEHFCCFFDPIDCRCSIYSERPKQCRTFPFWEMFKEDYSKLLYECPGIRVNK